MPCYNQARFLPQALVSVAHQTRRPDLFVTVDDGSSDGTPIVLADFWENSILDGHGMLHRSNRGSAAAINTGVARIATEVDALSWVSSDNVMTPEWLQTLGKAMEDRKAGVVYSGFWFCPPRRARSYLFTQHSQDRLLKDVNCYYGPSFLIRSDVWQEAGPHRGKISHDYDHWLRVEEVCFRRGLPIVGVDKGLCEYNAHDERATVVRKQEFDAFHWQAEAKRRRRDAAV